MSKTPSKEKFKIYLESYRQDVEAEMWAMIVAIVSVIMFTLGSAWAIVFILRYWIA